MDDNIYMEPSFVSASNGSAKDAGQENKGFSNGSGVHRDVKSWHPSHILDFSNLSIGQHFSFAVLNLALKK